MEANNITPIIVYPQGNGYVSSSNPVINGTGQPDATVNITVNNKTYGATVNQDGIWSVNLDQELDQGQQYTINGEQICSNNIKMPIAAVSFVVDTKSLYQHSVTMPANNQYIKNTKPTITGIGKSGATIEADISGQKFSTIVNQNGQWNIPLSSSLRDGANKISVWQKDMGNISQPVTVDFNVDTKAPDMPLITNPPSMGFESNPMPVISGQGEPNAEISLIIDENEYKTKAAKDGKWSFEISKTLSDDMHIISAKQKDLAGNISSENVSLFTVDTTTPEAPIIKTPYNGETISSAKPVISGYGMADSRIEINHNNKIYSSLINHDGSWSVNITDLLTDGRHSFNIYQIDKAGNVSALTPLTLIIDTTAPPAPVLIYPEHEGYVNTTSFTAKGTGEPDATIQFKVAGSEYETIVGIDGRWTITVDDDLTNAQEFTIYLCQIDKAKNISPSVKAKFYIKPNYLQAPSIKYPTDNTYINTEYPSITGTGYSGATINANINNITYSTRVAADGTWTILINQTLPQGANTITIAQIDKGNTSPAEKVTFYIDTIAPTAPVLLQPAPQTVINDNKLLIKGVGEADATIDLKIDNMNYTTTVGTNGKWEMNIDPISGIHTIIASQKDKAGNFSSPTTITCVVENIQTSNYKPDGKPATGTVEFNPPANTITTSVIATLTTNKPVIINNVTGTVFSRIITTNGISKFDFVDLEGHPGSVDTAITWIDDTPPFIDIQYNGNYFSADKTINYYKAGLSNLKNATINGNSFNSGAVIKDEGTYNVFISDKAGNTATKSFVIDKTAPTVLGVECNATYQNDVTISFYDNLSSIKSAFLNGTKIACGTTIKENGQYMLTVTDFADNKTELNFKISK